MKHIRIMLLIAFVVLLSACAGGMPIQDELSAVPAAPQVVAPPVLLPAEQDPEPEIAEPIYTFEEMTQAQQYTLPDGGEEYASYSYTYPRMCVENEEELIPSVREVAMRNVTAFNAEMERTLQDAVAYGKSFAEEIRMLLEEESFPWVGSDETTTSVLRAGEIVTVRANCYYFGGGAHPNTYSVSHTFDLSVGQFIDPAQVGDDPEAFRQGVAALLVEQAEGLGEDYVEGFWPDYPSIISRWNDTAVFFDESGMTVFFSAYELGPYAMGPVELFLDYDTLAPILGPGGVAHLGLSE